MSLPSLAIVLLFGSLGLSIALAPISVRRVGVRHVCTAIALLPIGTLLSVILPHLHKGWLEMAAQVVSTVGKPIASNGPTLEDALSVTCVFVVAYAIVIVLKRLVDTSRLLKVSRRRARHQQ